MIKKHQFYQENELIQLETLFYYIRLQLKYAKIAQFIVLQLITIKLIIMSFQEGVSLPKKILPHFKSTNYIETAARSSKTKIKRDMSTISNYYIATQRKNSDNIVNRANEKSIIEACLPDINSRHRSQKRSSFLQMWLEEALDPQEANNKQEEKKTIEIQKTGPLRTVQRFQIDKKYLKSQNIPGDFIDKLYNSLYVYTHGINNTFTEILALTKTSQHAEKRIVNSFWRAFIKLLQGCTSFRTSFQFIQQAYKKQILQMRENFASKQEQFHLQKAKLEEDIIRLNKTISQQSYNIMKLTNDFKIAQSTLTLTDQAFNDEVNLRLKFQEKVNAVYNSYEEIRQKYEKLLHDLQMRGDEQRLLLGTQVQLKLMLQQAQTKNQQYLRQLKNNLQALNQRDKEVQLKRQQIFELQGIIAVMNDKKDQGEQEVRTIIQRSHHSKQLNEDLKSQTKSYKMEISSLQERIIEQQKVVQEFRIANQQIFLKYEEVGRLLGEYRAERVLIQNKCQVILEESRIIKQQKEQASATLLQVERRASELQQTIQTLSFQLSVKNNCIIKNTEIISELQAVKDKFQRLYTITLCEKRKMQQVMNEAVKIKGVFEQEMTGMKLLLENRNIELLEANNKLENEREVFRNRINGLKQEIAVKQDQILQFHSKQLQDQHLMKENMTQVSQVQLQNFKLIEEKLQLSAQNIQKEKLIQQITSEREKLQGFFSQLNQKMLQLGKQNNNALFTLSNKQSLLEQIRGKTDKQKDLLKKLLQSYREDRQKKVCFIHPMIYQDLRMQVDRNTNKIFNLEEKIKHLQAEKQNLNQNIIQHLQTIGILKNGLARLDAQNEKKKQIIMNLEKNKKELEKNVDYRIKQGLQNQSKFKQKIKRQEQKQQQQRKNILRIEEQLFETKKIVKNQNETINKLEDQKKIQNIHYMAQEEQLNTAKADNARLKDELILYKRGESKSSARAQMLRRKSTLKDQDRQSVSTPKASNKQQTIFQEDGSSLKPIQEEHQKKQKDGRDYEIDARPHTVDRDCQTEKDKPKFSHSFKFEQQLPTTNSYGCQVDLITHTQQNHQHQNNNSPQRAPRVQGDEFKRALKITYMRR